MPNKLIAAQGMIGFKPIHLLQKASQNVYWIVSNPQ